MKLNLDIIIDNFPNSYQVKRFGTKNVSLSLKRPLLHEAGIEFENDRLYVARADTLPKIPPKKGISVVCVDLRPPQEWASINCQILLISSGQSLFTVFNEINKIYDKFDEWDNSLRNELMADVDFDLKRIIKLGMLVLKNPIAVINGTMLVIFHSEIITREDNEIDFIVSDDCISLSVEETEMVKNVCRLERVITVPYISSCAPDGVRFYCNNLYPFGYFAGCISMTETHGSFKESDLSLANYFFSYFQKAFVKYLWSIRPIELPGTVALNHLLTDLPLSAEEQEILSLDAGECWLCFKLKEKRTQNYMLIDYMYSTLSALMPGSVYSVIYDDAIIGLIKLRQADTGPNNNILNFFQAFLAKMEYIAGLSDEFIDINQIKIYLQQSNYAVEKGAQICLQTCEKNNLFHFGDYVLQYMISQCTGEFSTEHLYSKGLRILIEHDRSSRTNYVKTLDTYLKNEMSISRTASELFLHRSSLLKRLNRIEKLLNADLKDADFRLYLRVCLYLFEKGTQ